MSKTKTKKLKKLFKIVTFSKVIYLKCTLLYQLPKFIVYNKITLNKYSNWF